jgi:serine/threonine protein kinase/Leucine-rich repeat (LRR) protein
MTPSDHRVEALFHAALDRSAGKEREDFLQAECGGDPAVAMRVRRLLEAHEHSDRLLADAPLSPEIERELARLKPEEVGDCIGPYKLRERIGEGGFGIVWVAEQEQPVRRRVALKIIKLGMDTREVMARFEQERQALAMMDHPNIARVLDAGATATGRPFFAMELVRGVKITDYCDEQRLAMRERLELFIAVCQAVQHAHQKGIIHRDLKPSNILVTINDGAAVVKVIDFGVAKATQGRLSEHTIYTQFQQMIGTPLYMSPEQAEMTSLDIDTRSDIYALGVLLYELLTGRTPIDAETLRAAGLDEMRRLIREVDPPRPSARVKTFGGDELTIAAKRRHVEPAKLPGALRGDLDWIVMKCLEKDRKRRYDTANGLALDLRRHLENGIVTARPPTAAYLLGRLVRRNKLAFAAGAAIAASLVVGIAVSVWQAVRANRALDELRTSAPAFAEQSRALVTQERFDEAIQKLGYAAKLRPDMVDYLVAQADLWQSRMNLSEAAKVYRAALRVQPGHERAAASLATCEELLAAKPNEHGKLTRESLARLHAAMLAQQRPAAELMPVARVLGEENKSLVEYWRARLRDLPVSGPRTLQERLVMRDDKLALDLDGVSISDLSPLAGAPLSVLQIIDGPNLSDLSPLRGMKLTGLHLEQTAVADISPLREMRTLEKLIIFRSKITDLSPLRGLPLKVAYFVDCPIRDLAPLRGAPLEKLFLHGSQVTDLSPLAGMPLKLLDLTRTPVLGFSLIASLPLEALFLQHCRINDLAILQDLPLKKLVLWGCADARNFAVLRKMTTLELLLLPATFHNLPDEELSAIESLRNHPRLRQLGATITPAMDYDATGAKEYFWEEWDRDFGWMRTLRMARVQFDARADADRRWRVFVQSRTFSDCTVFKGARIRELNFYSTAVADIAPLAELPLEVLSLDATQVAELSPLRAPALSGALRELRLYKIPATDFSPLAALEKLEFLDAASTALSDLSVVRDRKLRVAKLANTKVADISALEGMPLEWVTLNGTAVTDLRPLHACRTLKQLVLPKNAREVEKLRALPALTELSYREKPGGAPAQTAVEFWAEFDKAPPSAAP